MRRSTYNGWGTLLSALAAFVIVILAIPAAEAASVGVPAENMTLDPSTAGEVVSDPSARDGAYLFIWSNATATTSITATEPVDKVVLRAAGRYCKGWPKVTLLINDQTVGTRSISNDLRTEDAFVLPSPLAAGTHTVGVRFSNDRYRSSRCDRDLLLDHVELRGSSVVEPSPPGDDTAPPPSGDSVYFGDGFDREADEFSPPWDDVNRAHAGRLTTVSTVARKGTHSAKFAVHDDGVAPLTYTKNPRAQLNKNGIFCNGDDRYVGFSVYFPDDFPTLPSSPEWGWLIVNSFGFAPPYGNVKSAGVLTVQPGDKLRMQYRGSPIWSTAMERGRWIDFVVHINFSTDPSVGHMEIWKDGAKQTFLDGTQTKYYQTFDPNATACGNLQPTNYRKKGMFEWATLYQDEIKVGTSYDAVAP